MDIPNIIGTDDPRWPDGPVACIGFAEGRPPFMFGMGPNATAPDAETWQRVIGDLAENYPAVARAAQEFLAIVGEYGATNLIDQHEEGEQT